MRDSVEAGLTVYNNIRCGRSPRPRGDQRISRRRGGTDRTAAIGRLTGTAVDRYVIGIRGGQVSVAESPDVIEVGSEEKLSTVGGSGGAGLTVTVTLELALPPGPVAISV